MIITKHDNIAILPKRCDKCNTLFIFEPYNYYYRPLITGEARFIKCIRCINKESKPAERGELEEKEE